MEGYGNNERFPRGLNPLPSSTPTQVKGDSELPPPSHAQANPGASGQLTGEPSGADFSRAAVRRRATESRCKGQRVGASSLELTAPKQRPATRSSSTFRGGTGNCRAHQAPPAVREGAKYEGSREVARPLSVGPSVRRSQVTASRPTHASSVNIGEQRRLERQQRQVVQFRLHSDKITKVSRSPSNAVRGPSPPDGPAGSVIPSEAHKYSASDASADPDLSHLQKRRTWVLLQHLVDQLEKDGRPDDLLQRPELLQKLLRVVMPLVPLRDALGKFAADSRTTNTAGLQGSVDERDYSPNRMAQRPSARPVSTACFRSMHANAPTRSAENRLRPTLHHNSRASPTRTLSASASRGVVQAPRGWSDDNPVASRPGVQYPGVPIDAPRNAFNGSSKDRDSRRAPSTRVRAVPKRDVGNSAEPGGLVAPLRWYDKPRPVRSVSTGNSYMHVASRLPQGALQHKRPLKTRSPAAFPEKNTEERKAFRPMAVNWAASPPHISEPVTEPVASARSEDSQDTLNSAVTPLLEDSAEDCPELGLPRQLGAGSRCAVDWNANMPQPLVRFTSTRVVEALPPSPRASNSDGETPQSGGSGRSVSASQGSPVTHEDPQSVDREAQLPALTKAPSPLPGSRRRLAAEPKAPAARRHTVATVVASAQHSTEEDRPIRHSGGSLDVPSGPPEKRERRLTATGATKFKSTAASIKGGRFVVAGEELDGGAKSQGMARIPLLKDIPKVRDGRRATVQVATPRDGSPFSPKLSAGARRKVSPVATKKLGKKGSRTFQKLSSMSPRELSPPSARGRRMSAPPPRRATQSKIAPTFPRARNMADRTSPPRVSSASFKTTARRKTVRITPAKDKEKTSEAQKDGESPPPEAQSTPPLEEKDEQAKGDENKETPEAVEPEPEPPYPYLTLKELPALDQPLRPLSHLCALPLKDGPSSPPPAEDSVTFIHVLERSERLTQDGRDEATRRAVSYLCNDGPGTMLLVARWLDSVADAVENNTVASSEKFPWREVIPPLFVGINKHRELLSSKMPRTQFSPKELREFLETEGFIETQGQKLQHLLETKGIPGKGSEAGAGSPSPKPRTPLDDYLDYLLAVAVDSLRKRQKPVVIPKITQHSFEVGEEPDSSCCCDASSSDQTLQSSQDEGSRSRCKTSLWGNLPLFASEKPLPRQRCASCLPIRGSSRAWFGKSNSLRRGFGFPCCYSGENTGPPELDLFESTAMQQVRATACRMPLLPSERYLRYLRLTGRGRELAALAIWLSGRPDLVSSYFERMAPKQQQASAAVRVNSSTPDKGTPRSPPSAESPGGEGGSPPSSPGGTQPEQESTPYADEASRSPIREGEAAREEHKGNDGEECQGSSKGAVLCPSSPVTLPLSSSPRNMGFLGNSLQGKDTDDRAELPTAGEDGLHSEGNHRNDSSGTIHAQSSPRKSPDLPSSPKIRAKLRARAAEPPSDKGNGGLLEGSPHSQRFTATQTSASKAKAKKFVAGRTPVSRVATIGQKTAAGSKPLRPLGQAQWQIPAVPGEPPSARDPQKTAKILATKQETADTAKCEPPESVGTADAMPDSREKESPAPSTRPEDFVESVSPIDADKVVSPAVRRIADTSSKQPREHPSKKQAVAQSKTLASRSSSTKRLNPAKTTSRRPAAAVQQIRTGALRREVQNAQSSASSTRLTEEAIDLLSEPQVLAEMARLCTRLSDLVCCRSPTSVDCHSGDDEGSSVT